MVGTGRGRGRTVIQELACSRVEHAKRANLRWRLGVAPWLWPPTEDHSRLAWATSVSGSGCPRLRPGRALAVSISDEGGTAWLLADDGDVSGPLSPPSWGRLALRAWKCAVLAMSRTLPVIGVGLKELVLDIPQAHYLDAAPRPLHSGRIEHSLDGASFGLAFALYLVSRLTNEALPDDVAALASVDADGDVGPVGALRDKLDTVRRLAPRVKRILISDRQEATRDLEADSGLVLIPVTSVSAAVGCLFERDLTERLVAAATDAGRRGALVEAFFRTVVTSRRAPLNWLPFHRAASLAMTSWDGLDGTARYRLEFVRAVAGRHGHGQNTLTLPPEGWLEGHPKPLRAGILANLVQHSADTGTPEADDVERLAQAYLADARESYAPQLAIRGALARLYSVTGREERALLIQAAVSRAFLAAFDDDNLSYALAEWFRLAGVCQSEDAFTEAEACRVIMTARGGLNVDGAPYVALSRCRAGLLLGCLPRAQIEAGLQAIQLDEGLPAHLRWSALRWRIRALESPTSSAVQARGAMLSILDQEIDARLAEGAPLAAVQARVFRALILVDQHVAVAEHVEAEQFLQELASMRGGPVLRLMKACPAGDSVPAYVARTYPY